MRGERALRIVLIIVGLIFLAEVYPLITSIREGWHANKEDSLPMGISLYVMQGIFLLLAARDPLANRGVITFAAWLNIAHAAVMTVMSIHRPRERQESPRCLSHFLPHRCPSDRVITSEGSERTGLDRIGSPDLRTLFRPRQGR